MSQDLLLIRRPGVKSLLRQGRRFAVATAFAGVLGIAPLALAANSGSIAMLDSRQSETATLTAPVFTSLDMVSTTRGLAWGTLNGRYALWATDDGGMHWHRRLFGGLPPIDSPNISEPVVYFENARQGWIAWVTSRYVGQPHSASAHAVNTLTVMHSRDGGRRWTSYHRQILEVMHQVEQIDFVGGNGWIRVFSGEVMNQGDTGIYHTTNNGGSWNLVSAAGGYVPNPQATPDALPAMDVPMPMTFTSANDGFAAVGNYVVTETLASIYHTTTAGRRWSTLRLPLSAFLRRHAYTTTEFAPIFAGPRGSVLVQFQGGTHGEVIDYQTTDGGQQWNMSTPFALQPSAYQVATSAISPRDAWVIGIDGGSFGRTQNGGQSWSNLPISGHLQAVFDGGYQVVSFNMISPTRGWMLVESGNQKSFALLRTRNGGSSWGIQRW